MSAQEDARWFRVYASIVDDDKLLLLADEDAMKYVKLLALKCSGVLDSTAPYLERRIALKLRISENGLLEVKRRLMEVGLIDDNFQPIAWQKRQFMSDHNGADRMRKYRERQRDVNVTSPLRHVTANALRESDVLETESETESEEETESERSQPSLSTNHKQDTPPQSGGSPEGDAARKRAAPRGTKRTPVDWQPDADLLAEIRAECPDVDIQAALREMRDCEFRTAHTDWPATFRNWVRREQKQLARFSGRARATPPQRETKFNRLARRLSDG
jgi:hypothetical protein